MPAERRSINQTPSYITRDGSQIQELLHPDSAAIVNQSLALATIPAGETTLRHRHLCSEEVYLIRSGEGEMQLAGESFSVVVGDAVVIPAGTPHAICNRGLTPLEILCCCAPPYAHDDTELLP